MSCKFACGSVVALILVLFAVDTHAAELVVSAGPKEPQDERKAFHVPAGFEVQLVASEPDIHKPINFSFDDRGRLWVTDTIEYPFPAPEGKPTRDTVKILEDFGPDGRARKITTFADNLNIPIGILPLHDNAALVYSIPDIWKFTDTTGAGKADKREIFLGTYAHDDTHGMTGSFVEGFDGWVYAVHGFRNTSTVKASDGSQITMNSGNTYRFKRDGSHIEYFTHGQVNPFGLIFDPLGDLYSSDCETKPIYMLLREAYYPSFGKPDDGLGFAPEMCDHLYGSTAIAGICQYIADEFPAQYHGQMFVGNVVTGRINAARLSPVGSGFHADDAPDFLVSDDAWYRPVNIKLGPDGALYVADFYNRIIGHYEVDLHHPGRDKQRGRIWRIVYKGSGATAPKPFDLTKASVQEMIDDMASPNFTIRMSAMNRLADVVGQAGAGPVKAALKHSSDPYQKVHGLWVLYRIGALEPAELQAAATDSSSIIREHTMRILGEMPKWESSEHELALAGLKDADPLVRRTAAEALGRHPQFENIRPLLDLREKPDDDPYVTHVVRIALRDHLLVGGVADKLAAANLNANDERMLADVAAGAPTPDAAAFLLRYLRKNDEDHETVLRHLHAVARYVPENQIDDLAKFIEAKFASDVDTQLALFKSMQEGLAERGTKPADSVRAWGTRLATLVLNESAGDLGFWSYRPLPGSTDTRNPWAVQMRASSDGDAASPFLSSLVHGEPLIGIARSKDFACPQRLTFYLAGHNGPPPQAWGNKNIVRLRDAKTDEVLAETPPPRHDIAQKVTWDLSQHAGRQVYFEATDGRNEKAYAWLAFGRFDPPVIRVPTSGPRLQNAVQIVQSLHLTDLAGAVEKLLANGTADAQTRSAAAQALGGLNAADHAAALASALRDPAAPEDVREAAATALGSVDSVDANSALVEAVKVAPNKLQVALAKALASTRGGAESLLEAISQGKASPRLLQDANVRERLNVAKPANLDERIAQLTHGLPAADEQIQKLIDTRATTYDPSKASPVRGKEIFTKNCAVCHKIGGEGNQIGPQLDGIGARGVARLCEDILDPSRNVDVAFRYSTYVLGDGNNIAGIPRREEGQTLIVADSTGKEVRIPKSQIKRQVESKLSLMPSNFGEVIPPKDFDDLLSFLLASKQQ
jgi:putative heme-binding domain-containing protein